MSGRSGVIGWLVRLVRPAASSSLGPRGESEAARFLKQAGYRVLSRNVRLPIGEIDILAESPDGRTVVVVEVKARAVREGERARLPERAITAAKGRKLAGLARTVSRRRGIENRPVRIDVVAVDFCERGHDPVAVRHYPNAINAAGARS